MPAAHALAEAQGVTAAREAQPAIGPDLSQFGRQASRLVDQLAEGVIPSQAHDTSSLRVPLIPLNFRIPSQTAHLSFCVPSCPEDFRLDIRFGGSHFFAWTA